MSLTVAKRYRNRRRPGERGVSAVEFGLILPVLIALVLGIMEYGYAYFVQINMTNAAREGARAGVVMDDLGAGATKAQSVAQQYLANAGLTASVPAPDTSNNSIAVTVEMNPYTPLIGFVPTPNRLRAVATMRWELAPTTSP